MAKNQQQQKEDNSQLVWLAVAGVALYLFTRKRYIVTIDPLSDPDFNNGVQVVNPAIDQTNRVFYDAPIDYYQEFDGQVLSGVNPAPVKQASRLVI